jgi:hypothetical protein
MIDCTVAAVAWRRRSALSSQDVDPDRVARVIGIDMDEASPRA